MSGIANDITGVGEAVTGASKIATTVEDTLFRLFPSLDKGDALRAAQEIQEKIMDQQAAQNASQSEVNKVEAGSPSLFVAGWRPAVGWVCAAGFAWAFVIGPTIAMFVRIWKETYTLPVLDTYSLTTLLLGMLGLGGMRMYEKVSGTEPPSTPIVTTKTTTFNGKPVRPALPV